MENKMPHNPSFQSQTHRYPTQVRQRNMQARRELANTVIDKNSGGVLQYKQLINNDNTRTCWVDSFSNELGRLSQGTKNDGKGSNTIQFIPFHQIPHERRKDITYGNIIVAYKEHKNEPHRTRLTIGGNRINYPGVVTTPTAEITTVKLLINSVISTRGARFMTADIRNLYLDTPMERPEYMFLPRQIIPQDIYDQYQLQHLLHNDKIYIRVAKGMYGLPQTRKLDHQQLITKLSTYGYHPCHNIPGLWKHEWRPITFTLVADDFGIKYVGREHAQHLITALQEQYSRVVVEWEGERYCGLKLEWNYETRHVDISMPEYIPQALQRFQHETPRHPQHSPYRYLLTIINKSHS